VREQQSRRSSDSLHMLIPLLRCGRPGSRLGAPRVLRWACISHFPPTWGPDGCDSRRVCRRGRRFSVRFARVTGPFARVMGPLTSCERAREIKCRWTSSVFPPTVHTLQYPLPLLPHTSPSTQYPAALLLCGIIGAAAQVGTVPTAWRSYVMPTFAFGNPIDGCMWNGIVEANVSIPTGESTSPPPKPCSFPAVWQAILCIGISLSLTLTPMPTSTSSLPDLQFPAPGAHRRAPTARAAVMKTPPRTLVLAFFTRRACRPSQARATAESASSGSPTPLARRRPTAR
jgi:hypothetical protein